ncbi:MBL fold metallo-hydrolase [Dinghuibacter silviterrae]|uniref:Glyoxylase-like metal-dependent hydrolase (Beta-lactamase superfamily II) n=1 Tax=Dinghuibacter silviterrae TaxID=1539049 RepID=A0A4R8DRV4_9BACT|nr:MBL fold metallo-hydrolase [Dinghuibacter silviterrae]TDX00155.1 glyoxylase-like metal-dependent hydrolase (beta-lactamase superfamily II) [Dinghuibacter silviterrae]
MRLYTLDTGFFKLDGGAMFGVVPKTIWNKTNPADTNNLCTWAMRCLLVEEGDRLIVIDTGIGTKQDERFFSHYYLHGDATLEKSLAAHGFTPNDVTDVFLTHLHFDHCGGAVLPGGKLAFPKATYWSNETHWNWAVHPNDREKASFLRENILPIQESGQLRFLDAGAPFQVRLVGGHTAAMMLPQIEYKGRTLVYMADLLPSVGHLPLPYVMAYDMFPLTTLQEKKAFLEEAVENQYILYFEHDPVNECCTLGRTEKGIRAVETFALKDL